MSSPSAATAPTPFLPPNHHHDHVMHTQPGNPHTTFLPTRAGAGQAMMSSGSQTQTQTSTPTTATGGGVPSGGEITAVLRLRGAHEPGTRRQIHWAEDVVDNEGLGRKSSKVCCIYHAPKAVGESSSEDDSSSGSESESDVDDGAARMVGGGGGGSGGGGGGGGSGKRRRRRGRGHDHDGHDHGDDCAGGGGNGSARKGKRRPSPNAYEKMPKSSARREVKR